MRLYLSRHAESVGNREFRLQGQRDFPLSERGVAQAEALAQRLAGVGLGAVYASPLTRTMQTAEIVARACGLEVRPEQRLQEYDFGPDISGLTWDAIREKHPDIILALSSNDSDFPRYPGEEGRAAFRERVTAAIQEILESPSAALPSPAHGRGAGGEGSPSVAIITHAGPIVVYLMESLGRRYSRPSPFAIDNASISCAEVSEPKAFAPFVLVSLNDTCHLREHEGDRLPAIQ